MKTTYIYCSTCKRVHERMPERRLLQLELEASLAMMGLKATREMMDRVDHEIAKACGVPVEFLRVPEDCV